MATYSRHAFQEEIIYPQMMAELTGENPDNYRGRPFDADLFDYTPSTPETAPPEPDPVLENLAAAWAQRTQHQDRKPAPAEAPRIVHPNGPTAQA